MGYWCEIIWCICFFFFKQKTEYEMRISDWSSDVCSSDLRRLQPDAVIFSDAGPDIRWIGNERGVAGTTNWSTVDPAAVPFPGATGERVMAIDRQSVV